MTESRFDRAQIGAVHSMAEATYFWKHQPRTVAARMDLPPAGIVARVRKVLDRVLMKERI